MIRTILGVLGALAALAAAAVGALAVVMRTKWEPGLRVVRQAQRRWIREAGLRQAGRPGDDVVVVHTVGRRSGKPYATPIGIDRTPQGLLATLPYGLGADWVRNLLAAGGGELTMEGERVPVTAPRLIGPDEAAPLLSAGARRVAAIFGITDYLLLQVDDGRPPILP